MYICAETVPELRKHIVRLLLLADLPREARAMAEVLRDDLRDFDQIEHLTSYRDIIIRDLGRLMTALKPPS